MGDGRRIDKFDLSISTLWYPNIEQHVGLTDKMTPKVDDCPDAITIPFRSISKIIIDDNKIV